MRVDQCRDRHAQDWRDLEQIATDPTQRPHRDLVLGRECAHLRLQRWTDDEHDARRPFTEEGHTLVYPTDRRKGDLHPDPVTEGELGQRDREAALGAVVRCAHGTGAMGRQHESLEARLATAFDAAARNNLRPTAVQSLSSNFEALSRAGTRLLNVSRRRTRLKGWGAFNASVPPPAISRN